MKTIIAFLIGSFFFSPHNIVSEKWVIERSSNLCIEGKSNVTSFRCDVTEYLQPDTIQFFCEDMKRQLLGVKGGLAINVNRFDCHQRYMTGDLRKTLKANECPWLKIDLLSIGNFMNGNRTVKGDVSISLAGVTKKIEINYTVEPLSDGNLKLLGTRQVLFSDFGLTPPRKLAGLIIVQEEINVRFTLFLRPLQQNATGKLN